MQVASRPWDPDVAAEASHGHEKNGWPLAWSGEEEQRKGGNGQEDE